MVVRCTAKVFLSAGEEFRDETSEHDEVKFATGECVEETDEGVLESLRASGERSSSKSDMQKLVPNMVGGFFAAAADCV